MHFVLRQRVFDFIGEHACREARDDLFGSLYASGVQHVVVDQHVIPEERHLEWGDRDQG